jgi:mono/diheme cytochrome c family protein
MACMIGTITGIKMTDAMNRFSVVLTNGLLLGALVLLSACGQKPTEDVDAAPAAEAPPSVAEPQVNERGVQSVDADGNVAPFGMASRKPVPLPELAAAPVEEVAAVAATSALYGAHCSACHGQDATGVQGLGLNLVESELVADSSEEELAAFLKAGRAGDSPDNTTGVPMPSFVWMSDENLAEITGHLQSL